MMRNDRTRGGYWGINSKTLIVVILALTVLQYASPGASAAGVTGGHSNVQSVASSPQVTLPRSILAGIPGGLNVKFNGVGAFTTDSSVADNSGVSSNITIPTGWSLPTTGCLSFTSGTTSASLCAILGVEEPFFNASSIAAVGALFVKVSSISAILPVAILPNETFVVNPPAPIGSGTELTSGTTYDFTIVHSTGTWWDFDCSGTPITGGSTTAWENGTYNLNTSSALGIVHNSTTDVAPMQFLSELNTSFVMPQTNVPTALAFELKGSSSLSYEPVSGNALAFNLTTPFGIQGKDQLSSLSNDEVNEAGSLSFPGEAQPLWGNADVLGIVTPQAMVYATETGLDGNVGMSASIYVPGNSNVTLAAGQGEFFGFQEPLNDTTVVGAGVYEYLLNGSLTASPYYFDRASSENSNLHISKRTLMLDSTVRVATATSGNGTWNFTANGVVITNATGNGWAPLGLDSASAVVASASPSEALFTLSSFPLLGAYGNGTVKSVYTMPSLYFDMPGRGWLLPDFASGYYWGTSVKLDGQYTDATIPRGEVMFGSTIPSPLSTPGGLIWQGALGVAVKSTETTLIPGQNVTLTANVTSGISIPSQSALTVLGSAGAPVNQSLVWTYVESGTNWSEYTAPFTGPSLSGTSWLNFTINVTAASQPDYANAKQGISFTLKPAQLVVSAHSSAASIIAGQTADLYIFVNNTLGAVAGATITVTGTPSISSYISATTYLGNGEYTVAFTPPATLSVDTNYSITINATKSGELQGEKSLSISATPLPLLVVTVSFVLPSGGLESGENVTIFANVTANGAPVSGVTVTFTLSSLWTIKGGNSGITDSSGTYATIATAPTVSATTAFTLNASASLKGYRSGSASQSLSVKPAPPAPTSSGFPTTILYGIIGAVIVVVVVVALLMVMKKKKGPQVSQDQGAQYGGDQQGMDQQPAGWGQQGGGQ